MRRSESQVEAHLDPWNLEDTRNCIESIYGRSQLELANPCIRSIGDRQIYALIHYQDALGLFDEYVATHLNDTSLLNVALLGSDEARAEFNVFIRKIGAHLIACIQSIHSLPDVLSHVIYYSLGKNLSPDALRARNIDHTSVLKKLVGEPDAQALCGLLDEICSGGSFRHLSALANHSKHRSVIFPSLNEDWTGERSDRLLIFLDAFDYEGTWYPQVGAREFLEAEYSRVSKLVVQCGSELNSMLRSRAL